MSDRVSDKVSLDTTAAKPGSKKTAIPLSRRPRYEDTGAQQAAAESHDYFVKKYGSGSGSESRVPKPSSLES